MALICKFVDSIASVPTTRLDINDGTTWTVTKFEPGLPRLRRAASANAMSHGIFVSSSTYDARRLMITLVLNAATADANGTEIQKLARELDRTDNYLMYQPNGFTKPVFFRTLRSDFAQLEQFVGSTAYQGTIEVLAEPFALGLKEAIGPVTVNNDPAAGSNGLFVDATGVIGDVAAPAVIVDTTMAPASLILGVRQTGTPSDLIFFKQAESCSLFTDTTNPGGGPDAAMSGAGVNNFVRCSFATATLIKRLTWVVSSDATTVAQRLAMRGRYNVLAIVRRSDATSVIRMAASNVATVNDAVTVPLSTARQIVSLGLVSLSVEPTSNGAVGYATDLPVKPRDLQIHMARDSGAGTIDVDFLMLLPADSATMFVSGHIVAGDDAASDLVIDSMQSAVISIDDAGDPFTTGVVNDFYTSKVGGFPQVVPNQTNRFYLLTASSADSTKPFTTHTKSGTQAVTVNYWPRYLFVRPSAT